MNDKRLKKNNKMSVNIQDDDNDDNDNNTNHREKNVRQNTITRTYNQRP